MTTKFLRFEDDKVIHVASGSINADKNYIEAKAKRFDETNRRLQQAFGKYKRRNNSNHK
ncbi:hypothetical protein EV207_11653 [Scopulibacillus darangshiensis]|uniref:Uncharacterized protein n=1 Tax=Scopulibacillus darangshiensis TaxID=442528 RepID=A0A4R2P483_9BACL|nr:hypothetical protein [Scopulibacillus darangshiensis]TCP28741.1 hypothetical protein EV207_11653 [Scopulibacillus darangshiensis]